MAVNGKALAAVTIGSVFVWSGIKGWSILGTIGDIVKGVKPSGTVVNPVQSLAPGAGIGTATQPALAPSSGLAGIAMQYVGHPYRFGGAPGANGENPWDCSSFMNYVVAIKGGKAIPGYAPGKYTGTSHGPPTGSWAIWTGMTTIPRSQVQAGDIILWLGHMGMAVNDAQMISALNPREKTKVTFIDAGVGRGPIVRIGRLS